MSDELLSQSHTAAPYVFAALFHVLGFVSSAHHFLFVSTTRKSKKYRLSKLSICFYDSCSCVAILGVRNQEGSYRRENHSFVGLISKLTIKVPYMQNLFKWPSVADDRPEGSQHGREGFHNYCPGYAQRYFEGAVWFL